jgi:hypothetical protein
MCALKGAILTQINAYLTTQINAAQAMKEETEPTTVTSVPTPEGVALKNELKRESKPIGTIMDQLRKEATFRNGRTGFSCPRHRREQ